MGTGPILSLSPTVISVYRSQSPFISCDAVFGNGDEETGNQTTASYPIIFSRNNLITNPEGYIFKFRPGGQNWQVTNQILDVTNLGFKGISRFDMNISKFTTLESLTIGSTLVSVINGVTTTSSGNVRISIFDTIFPTAGSSILIFLFENNLIDCNFNPTFNKIHTFKFNNNAQSSPITVNSTNINRIIMNYNNFLTNVTINSFASLSTLDLNNNGLTQVSIKSVYGTQNTSELTIGLRYNNFTTFETSWVTNYPTASKNVSISLSNNYLTTFNCVFSGPSMNVLDLSNQFNSGLDSVNSVATSGTTFKEYNFSNNRMTTLPILGPSTQKFYCQSCASNFNGVNKGTGVIIPNLPSGLKVFQMDGGGTPETTISGFSDWTPNSSSFAPNNFHTRLGLITTLEFFSLKNQKINTWEHGFSPTVAQNAILDLSDNNISNFNMFYFGGNLGFSNIRFSNQSVPIVLTNFNSTTLPNLSTLDLQYNTFRKLTDLISVSENWPPKLNSLFLSNCLINSDNSYVWNKSFATFSQATTSFSLNFQNSFGLTSLHNNNIGFIIRNFWSGTTKQNGIINFQGNGLTQSTVDSQTWGCLNCLTLPINTPCSVAGVTTSLAFGRNISILY